LYTAKADPPASVGGTIPTLSAPTRPVANIRIALKTAQADGYSLRITHQNTVKDESTVHCTTRNIVLGFFFAP